MFYIGLDLGQRRDHSALVVVERRETMQALVTPRFDVLQVRHAERAPLGTPYPHLIARVREMVRHQELRGQCQLAVDETGVGGPVVEMLRAAQLGCEIQAVTITGGEREHAYAAGGGAGWRVPKQDLMAGVQIALEKGELRIARRMEGVGSLVKELMDVRATPLRQGRVRVGADRHGEHDDLVIALALACWSAKRKKTGFGTRRLTGI